MSTAQDGYRERLATLLARAAPTLSVSKRVTFKSVFGAVGAYVDGSIFATCGNFGVALRLPPGELSTVFVEDGVEPLRYFPKGHVKREYAVLPERLLEDEARIRLLMGASIAFVVDGVER
jgi:TfoX/Sxy family transcriptional regulator of competence genes